MVTTRSGQSQTTARGTAPAMVSSMAGMVSSLAGVPIPIPMTISPRMRSPPSPPQVNREVPPSQPQHGELLDFIRRQGEMLQQYAQRLNQLEHNRAVENLNHRVADDLTVE
ncbi:zinc finger homeobox protein 4 isoform X1 [Sesbania bispinosa]|nr:zinc finger homeobox protein 4 isoform X1 [Sesbania bispinosa]